MDCTNNNTESCKNKYLNFEELMTTQFRIKDGFSVYRIAKELNRPINTVLNEIRRGTTTQVKQEKKVEVYLADTGEAIYLKNRQNPHRLYKRLECRTFINYVTDRIINSSCPPDACFGNALKTAELDRSQVVCTKTL
ncbi:helix-turn-helix domain protein [Clostridium argentinense CDC 2741]|uniref:Helix-turn-helix domain protein n=1 Tax=Clostridium argentinense CDC 2741 TaxID=1418104 RepID=A0A0C1U570_9CLOT|nr:helix-turn-helix domain-containing protein [Clostridium argentinense]ARC86228.1 hypothetical protein RSJ17_17890 [Clostridium argentinense]KIE47889.1 helix-turn-helix domain protein [Clostridium argentinense CDC 2741]NFF40255.1 hypothetical protein [Clostridium argentinense]NFP50064.1 hypothetical protein [Clostridium argentinense]NFP74609.1 hypothetical protein [Clostridium argentinense]